MYVFFSEKKYSNFIKHVSNLSHLFEYTGKNGAKCNPSDGSCSCSKGWKSVYCEDRVCPDHMYGEKCQLSCECDKNTTRSCHPYTGKCDCNAGWSSSLCNRPCPFLTWGENCANDCNCNGANCSPINGDCICSPGYQGRIFISVKLFDFQFEFYADAFDFRQKL